MKVSNLSSKLNATHGIIKNKKGFPGRNEGGDGSVTFRTRNGKTYLCYKLKTKWYYLELSSNPNSTKKTVLPNKLPVFEGEMSIHGGRIYSKIKGRKREVLFKDSEVSVEVGQLNLSSDVSFSDDDDSNIAVNETNEGPHGVAFRIGGSYTSEVANSAPDSYHVTDRYTETGGTIDSVYLGFLKSWKLESTSANVTATDAATLFLGIPAEGENVDIANRYALHLGGDIKSHNLSIEDTGLLTLNATANVNVNSGGDMLFTVTGGSFTIADDTATDPDLILLCTNDSSAGPQFFMTHDSASPAINDFIGSMYFRGNDSGGNAVNYSYIQCQSTSVTDGSEHAKLKLFVASPTAGGITIKGISDGRIDTDIGLGSASLTTIAGDLDIDGDTITSAGTLEIDPGGALSITGDHVNIDATKKLYLDGGGNTYIVESSGDVISLFCGGSARLVLGTVTALFSDSVALKSGEKLHFDGTGLGIDTYIHEVSADKLEFMVGGDEMLTLDEANQRVTIEADKLTYAIAGGTEWGAPDSAYAGHILGYTCIGADVNYDSYTLTTSFVCFQDSGGNEIRSRFNTPPSEFVEIEVELYFSSGSGASDLFLSLSDNSTYASNTLHHDSQFEKLVCSPARGNGGTVVQKFLLNSDHLEAIGSANNIYIAAKTDSTSGTPLIRWGGDTTGELTNLVMKATALPVAITVGS